MTIREQLEQSVDDGAKMSKFRDTEEFKWFRNDFLKKISEELVSKIAYRDEDTEKRMITQMKMISALDNIVEGTIRKGEIDKEQLLNADEATLNEKVE